MQIQPISGIQNLNCSAERRYALYRMPLQLLYPPVLPGFTLSFCFSYLQVPTQIVSYFAKLLVILPGFSLPTVSIIVQYEILIPAQSSHLHWSHETKNTTIKSTVKYYKMFILQGLSFIRTKCSLALMKGEGENLLLLAYGS